MLRTLLLLTSFACALTLTVSAQDKKDDKKEEKKLTVDLFASLEDRDLQKEMPENGVVVSQKGWEKLAKAWSIKEPAKVDFDKEILIVATTVGSQLRLGSKLDDKGDPVLTERGNPDANYLPFKYIAQRPSVLYLPDITDYTQILADAEKQLIPIGVADPTVGYVSPLLALTAMEEPVSFEADSLRTEKTKVLSALVLPKDLHAGTARGVLQRERQGR